MVANRLTLAGLAGMGVLVATCSSPLSRNRTFGERLGSGMTLQEVIAATKQTAEGVKSCESVLELARKHDVERPQRGEAAVQLGDAARQVLGQPEVVLVDAAGDDVLASVGRLAELGVFHRLARDQGKVARAGDMLWVLQAVRVGEVRFGAADRFGALVAQGRDASIRTGAAEAGKES